MLYFVGTPIGNLEDLSPRAVRTLREVDAIGAEDTRHTLRLLTHFDIHTPLFSFHQHNERQRTDEIVARLHAGESIAIVSDAGMPLVSDAGSLLAARLRSESIAFTCVPGPSAADTALVLSGLPSESFLFLGFVPREARQQDVFFETVLKSSHTVICFESPRRIVPTLQKLRDLNPERLVAVARELTKIHEETLRGPVTDVLKTLSERGELKGEYVLLVAPKPITLPHDDSAPELATAVENVRKIADLPLSTAVKIVAAVTGVPRNRVYDASLK